MKEHIKIVGQVLQPFKKFKSPTVVKQLRKHSPEMNCIVAVPMEEYQVRWTTSTRIKLCSLNHNACRLLCARGFKGNLLIVDLRKEVHREKESVTVPHIVKKALRSLPHQRSMATNLQRWEEGMSHMMEQVQS